MERFVTKVAIKSVIIVLLTVALLLVFNNTIVTNDIALNQLVNSDEAYLLMKHYNRIRTIVSSVYGWLSGILLVSVVHDIFKFKSNRGEN